MDATSLKGGLVFFGDEQPVANGLLLGGFLLQKSRLFEFDEAVLKIKVKYGLSKNTPIKWNLRDKGYEEALSEIQGQKRREFKNDVLSTLEMIPCSVIMSHTFCGSPQKEAEAYIWTFENLLQRIGIILHRKSRQEDLTDDYPMLDVVMDWFPGGAANKDEYFKIYSNAYWHGYDFRRNTIPPLRDLKACPTLLITSCKYSLGLQVADHIVGATSEFIKWCYDEKNNLPKSFGKFMNKFHEANHQTIGYGFITKGNAKLTFQQKWQELASRV